MSGRPRLVEEGTPIYGPGSEEKSSKSNYDSQLQNNNDMQVEPPEKQAGSHPPKLLKKRSSLQEAAEALRQEKEVVSPRTSTSGFNGNGSSSSLQAAAASVRVDGGGGCASKSYVVSAHNKRPSFTKKDIPVTGRYVVGAEPSSGPSPSSAQIHDPMEVVLGSSIKSPYLSPGAAPHSFQVQSSEPPPLFSDSDAMDHEMAVESVNTRTATSYVIGGGGTGTPSYFAATSMDDDPVERMEGVEDHGTKLPLVVLDGANVAYAYAQAMATIDSAGSSLSGAIHKPEPDVRGIQVATQYFLAADLRVLVVLPAPWFRSKPRAGDRGGTSNSLMETPQLEILNDIKAKGLLVAAPPTDDDDAYALTIAQREQSRSKRRNDEGPGFVLSNDMFRDAMDRDGSGQLRQWLKEGDRTPTTVTSTTEPATIRGPGRISFAFCDMGTMNDRGDRILDFVPNPRHPLVAWAEQCHNN